MTTETKVGAFVVAALVLLAATIYGVHATRTVRGQVRFKTYLRDAGGLDADTGVLFGGIRVGQVTAVRPDTDNPTRIEIAFEVKAGTQPGTEIRLRGRGVPHLRRSGVRGDLHVMVDVTVPTRLSKKERGLLEAYAEEAGEAVASGGGFIDKVLGKKAKGSSKASSKPS